METIYKKLNKACLFHDVNQKDEVITKMMCPIYFGFINAKYNWIIDGFNEDDIKEVAEKLNKAWKFSYKDWGYLSHWITAVYDHLNDNWYDCNLSRTKNDSEVKEWLNRWYAVWLGIKVNNNFYKDTKDGKIDTIDYKELKGNIWHATNIIKWTCRGKFDCTDNWKEMILDSYFIKGSTYTCNIDEVLAELDMETKYIIH